MFSLTFPIQRRGQGKLSGGGKGGRGSGGEASRKIFGATPFTLAQNAPPNIMLTISDKETLIIL